jgi:hypothetical protein
MCQQKRVAILPVRPRNIQHPPLPDGRRALNDLTKLLFILHFPEYIKMTLSSTQLAMPVLVRTVTTTFRHHSLRQKAKKCGKKHTSHRDPHRLLAPTYVAPGYPDYSNY